MECIQTENKAVDLFGAGNHGFKAGEPGAGVLATFVSPAWCNGVQEEILNVIRAAGIVPAGGDLSQMAQAINALVSLKTGGVGEIKTFYDDTAPAGWLKANGETIGSAASGATARANADTLNLFTKLWNKATNAVLPIQDSTGAASVRGASAAADFAANKRMPLPDVRGEYLRGWDDGRGVDGGRVLGSAQSQQLLQHSHGVNEAPHGHTTDVPFKPFGSAGGNPVAMQDGSNVIAGYSTIASTAVATGISIQNSVGGAELRTRNMAFLVCISY